MGHNDVRTTMIYTHNTLKRGLVRKVANDIEGGITQAIQYIQQLSCQYSKSVRQRLLLRPGLEKKRGSSIS